MSYKVEHRLEAMRWILLGLQDSATKIYHECNELCKEIQKISKDLSMKKEPVKKEKMVPVAKPMMPSKTEKAPMVKKKK